MSIMKYILLVGLLTSNLLADQASLLKELYHLNKEQRTILISSYKKGGYYDLGYTLTAICWAESRFGQYTMNLADGNQYKYKGSYGAYHTLLNTVCVRRHIITNWRASRTAEKLVRDPGYASTEAIIELLYWDKYWQDKKVPRKWSHTVASYNAGYRSYKYTAGKRYLANIKAKVKALKLYIKANNITTTE